MGSAGRAQAPQSVAYTVTVADTRNHEFQVTATAQGLSPTQTSIRFAIPAWSPGWYVLTHAYRNVHNVSATDETGHRLALDHPDLLTWEVDFSPGVHDVTLSYGVTAEDRDPDALDIGLAAVKNYGFFTPYLDDTNGFVPGPEVLLYVVGGIAAPCTVTYQTPPDWKIASANNPTSNPNTFAAPTYDTLADQPADLGKFLRFDHTIEGTPVSEVIVGSESVDTSRWVDRTFRIAAAEIGFWGPQVKPPFPRYLFQFRFPPDEPGGGGLEHLNGTVITLDRSALSAADPDDMELVAHEMFHAWNVKRARPEKLGPFDYAHAVRVKDLWWSEGVTDYFAPHIVVEAGLADQGYWLNFFGAAINDLQRNGARKRVTLETASLKAWEGKSEGYGGLSYYNKGAIVGLLLDIEMRRRTGNRIGLIDVMKGLVQEAATTGKGFPDGEIERLTSRLTGSDFSAFFDRALRSTDELPYNEILPAAGLKLTHAAAGDSQKEGSARRLELDIAPDATAEQRAILRAISGPPPTPLPAIRP